MTSDKEHLNAALANVRAAVEDVRKVKRAAGDAVLANNCGVALNQLVAAAETVEEVRDGGTPAMGARWAMLKKPVLTRWDVAIGAMFGYWIPSALFLLVWILLVVLADVLGMDGALEFLAGLAE